MCTRYSKLAFAACLAIFIGSSTVHGQDEPAPIQFKELGKLECIDDGEHRFGDSDRLFLIEDKWEWDRCKRLIPKLPHIDLASESLLVIMSYESRPRTFQSVRREAEKLVIGLQQPAVSPYRSGGYHPPKFAIIRLPAWPGPVQFEINGHSQFTILRGAELDAHVDELWEEILRLHSGGMQTLKNQLRYYQHRRLEPFTEDELLQIKTEFFKKAKGGRPINNAPLYAILFRDLMNLKAKSAAPRIFKLIDAMGQHDRAFDPAWKTLVAIGGEEVVEGCHRAVKSENRRSRLAGALVLRDLAVPETRPLAHELLMGTDILMVRASLPLLQRLGLKREDVPALVKAIDRLEARIFKGANSATSLDYASSDDINSVLYALGALGPDAEEALPTLERIAEGGGYTSLTRTPEVAREMIGKINPDVAPIEPQ